MKKLTLLFLLSICIGSFSFGQRKGYAKDSILISKGNYLYTYIKVRNAETIKDSTDEFYTLEKQTDVNGDIIFDVADDGGDLTFFKRVNKGVAKYSLFVLLKEGGPYKGKGLTLTLDNGKQIIKPNADIDYHYDGSIVYMKTEVELTTKDIVLLKENGIQKYELCITEGSTTFAKQTKDRFNYLIKAK